jgi:hypothetical protein
MSWGTCYSGSNNIDFNYPPLMNDGRNFSSWQPESVVNNRIQKQENITSNWEYRQYLTNNGRQIQKYNTSAYCYEIGVGDNCYKVSDKTPSDNVPFLFKSTFDSSKPGFGYNNSDLKNPYLSREQLYAKMVSTTISPPKY